jgi:hypothetical protein
MDVSSFLYEGRIVWTMTTNGYKLYTFNLLKSIQAAKVPWKLCIICCDAESYTFFRREGIPAVAWRGTASQRPAAPRAGPRAGPQISVAAFGTNEFKIWNRVKIDLLRWFATSCVAEWSLYLDGDIVVRRDPWPPLLSDSSGCDFFFQCDCGHARPHSDASCKNICSGVIFTRHRDAAQAGLYDMNELLWKASLEQDQPYIAARLAETSTPFRTLPRQLFGNGEWQKGGAWGADDWVLLHYNFRVGDTKRAAMKKDGHWRIVGLS